jgi:integrase
MARAAVIEIPAVQPAKEEKKPRRNRGEGRIFKKAGSNNWWIQWYQNGRGIRESCGSPVKGVAVEMLRDKLLEAKTGAVPLADAKRVSYESMRGALYDHYQTNKLKSLLRKKDGTRYLGTVPPLDRFFKDCKASEISYHRLMSFIKDRQNAGKANSTINRSLTALQMMFNLAVKAKRIPAAAVPEFPRLKEDPPREDYFTPEEYQKVADALPDYLKPVFAVAQFCGMRETEILSRKWTHIDLDAGLIHLLPGETENDDGRIVPMVGPVQEMLKALRAANPQSEYVFTRGGQPIQDFRHAWKSALEKAGLVAGREGHVFHGTRRSAISMHADLGIDEQLSMAITGHRDPGVHRRYRQLRKQQVLAAQKVLNEKLGGREK